ncbi:hypothetical protein Rhsp01_31450 [Rhizobium sp. NBRC 114257]|uniref:DUF4424 domain-containing protein n=1 Tax=Rhizobium dioscoreae TaxID=2653122 RepID=A0ABQ0Z455_9HYPH|nr:MULTISPECIES: DUF4424 domain-containing protein [Rhizobium]GES50270.1 hypothetical protein RsS93_28840 [Rhizobium dioscoreae]GLU81969.1 hypothetical protein Rhsp01_31450 [Rhizobium sp. NBRC 114257]
MWKIGGYAALMAMSAAPAMANDTMAELKTGGLAYVRTGDISMDQEKLFISPEQVRVDYVFENMSDKDVESVVAFPMPDIKGDIDSMVDAGNVDSDNFLGFTVTQGGKAITPILQQRVSVAGVDMTDELKAHGVPLLPLSKAATDAVAKLPVDVLEDWTARGLIADDEYDADGQGMKHHPTPMWTLHTTYWWRTKFPAKARIAVEHRYKPSVGGTVAITFAGDEDYQKQQLQNYRAKYCLDEAFLKTAVKLAAAADKGGRGYTESWISYVLTTGANWSGPIKHFELTVDKGSPENYISFCGTNVKKIGATTFQMTAQDFYPEHDLEILILAAAAVN